MAVIEPLSDADARDEAQQVFRILQERFGMVPNIFRVMGHHPKVLSGFLQLYEAIQQDLSPELRELAYLKASVCNGCAYCTHHHKTAAKTAGLTSEQIEAVVSGDESPFDPRERAVLRFAEQLTLTTQVDEQNVDELRKFLSDPQFIVLTATVCSANWTNRFNHACGVELP